MFHGFIVVILDPDAAPLDAGYPGNVLNTHLWRPDGTGNAIVWRGWYTVDGIGPEEIRRLAVQDRATTFEEDIYLVGSVQRGSNSGA